MNTTRLAKFYPALTAVERLRLIHDAGRRGDAIEQRRLLDAAPRRAGTTAWPTPGDWKTICGPAGWSTTLFNWRRLPSSGTLKRSGLGRWKSSRTANRF